MKKYLLPKEGKFYKANLHTHSVLSTGKLTPEELKAEYKNRGYSVLAFTDHNIMVPHQDLADEEFLPLNGYELDVTEPFYKAKTCHFNLIALEPDNLKQVCFHRERWLAGNAKYHTDKIQYYEEEPDYIREYTPECINDMMRKGLDHGFFVIYNHPTWSCESYEQYIRYEYMHAMEIANYTCQRAGFEEYNARVYDDMLRAGKRVYCVGTDDSHCVEDCGGAWTMIKADKLEYRTITKALEDGHFYASQGPEIQELYIEDGQIHITTSDVEQIIFCFGMRKGKLVKAAEGEVLHYASVELDPKYIYVRVTVVDHRGRKANTNAYFIE